MIFLCISNWKFTASLCRAETLASEIKDLQGELADYNTVNTK